MDNQKKAQTEAMKLMAPAAPIMRERLTKADKDAIKAYFQDEWATLQTLRDLFFGFELREVEQRRIKQFSPELKATLKKMLLPELTKENPIGTSVDLWMTVNIVEKAPEHQKQAFAAREILIDLQKEGLELLENYTTDKIDLDITKGTPIEFVIARNMYVDHIEQVCIMLNTLAYQKDETPEEMAERIRRDSAK